MIKNLNSSIHSVSSNGVLYALLVSENYHKEGVNFFTEPNDYLQVGYMNRPKGYKINPHAHNKIVREVGLTQEVLYLKSGKVSVTIYDNNHYELCNLVMNPGDFLILIDGGHQFYFNEKSEIFEVKQGPYLQEDDKYFFEPKKL